MSKTLWGSFGILHKWQLKIQLHSENNVFAEMAPPDSADEGFFAQADVLTQTTERQVEWVLLLVALQGPVTHLTSAGFASSSPNTHLHLPTMQSTGSQHSGLQQQVQS